MSVSWESMHGIEDNPKPVTQPRSEVEEFIYERYDPVSGNNAEKAAGLLLRAATNIARYRRSSLTAPEHYEQLIRATQLMVGKRIAMATSGELFPATVEEIREKVEAIDWEHIPSVPRPVIEKVDGVSDQVSTSVVFKNTPRIHAA